MFRGVLVCPFFLSFRQSTLLLCVLPPVVAPGSGRIGPASCSGSLLLYLATSCSVYAFTKIAGGIVGEKRGFIFSPSPFFFHAISCLQKPLMPIQHQHQGAALMSILAADLFLSPLPAALPVSLLLSIPPPFIPFLFPPLALNGYCTIK